MKIFWWRKRCPGCGSTRQARIHYGYCPPNLRTAKLQTMIHLGLVVLGGCVIHVDDPEWQCRDCGHEWGKYPVHCEVDYEGPK